jgi:hypothetical protein
VHPHLIQLTSEENRSGFLGAAARFRGSHTEPARLRRRRPAWPRPLRSVPVPAIVALTVDRTSLHRTSKSPKCLSG